MMKKKIAMSRLLLLSLFIHFYFSGTHLTLPSITPTTCQHFSRDIALLANEMAAVGGTGSERVGHVQQQLQVR